MESSPGQIGGRDIALFDVSAKKLRIVSQVGSPDHDIDPVIGTEAAGLDYLLYTELSNPIGDQNPEASWQLWAFAIQTGQRRLVAADARLTPGLAAPYPRAQGRWVVWTQFVPGSRDWDLLTLDLDTWKARTLAHHLGTQSPSVDGGVVYFDARNPQPAGGVDVYAVAADGSSGPRQVTHSGKVALPRAADGLLAWQEPASSQAQSEWVQPESASPPELIADDSGGNVVPGHGFVLWYSLTRNALMATPVSGRLLGEAVVVASSSAMVGLDLGPRWSAFDRWIAWGTDTLTSPSVTTIHVAELTD